MKKVIVKAQVIISRAARGEVGRGPVPEENAVPEGNVQGNAVAEGNPSKGPWPVLMIRGPKQGKE